jgi:hypothetical protein
MEDKVYELFIEEDNELSGVEAISIVEEPAIEEDFVALRAHKIQMAEVNAEKRILMGPALIPNKKIYRRNDLGDEYHIFFSEDTVRKASQLFLSKGNQNNSTLEHQYKLKGMSVVESWIVEDEAKDKSAFYNLSMPKGTWMISVKVNNEEVWEEFVKTGKVKGFSIEGYFSDNAISTISYLLWGGKSMKNWVESKLKGLEELEKGVPHYTADGKLWTGPTHKDADGRLMTGETHTDDSEYLYHREDLAEIGPRGGVRKSSK